MKKQKFGALSEDICGDFTHAERIVALNSPLMQIRACTSTWCS